MLSGARPHARRGVVVVLANIANVVLTLGRTKLTALYLGSATVGWIALANNIIDTIGFFSAQGVGEAYNRELARARPRFTPREVFSSGIGLACLLFAIALPVASGVMWYSGLLDRAATLVLVLMIVAALAAAAWRLLGGLMLGLAMSRQTLVILTIAGALNLGLTAAFIFSGVRLAIVYVVSAHVTLGLIAVFFLRGQIAELFRAADARAMPARGPILALTLPLITGAVLEPLGLVYLRAQTADHFGATGVGLIQPGLLIINLGSTLINSFLGMTLVRWDQSAERPLSPRMLALFAAALAVPLIGTALIIAIYPLIGPIVRLLFSSAFLAGTVAVPWFVAGESLKIGANLLAQTLISRGQAWLTVIPKVIFFALIAAALALREWQTIEDAAQAYCIAYAGYHVATLALWLAMQVRARRAGALAGGESPDEDARAG